MLIKCSSQFIRSSIRNRKLTQTRKIYPIHQQMSKRVFITDFFRNKSDSNKKIKVVNKVKNENLVSKAQTVVESGKEVSDPVEYDQRNEKVQETTISSTPSDRLLESGGYADFCKEHHFDKVAWIKSLTVEQREILQLEINHLHITWLAFLHKELTKPYFIALKKFLKSQLNKTIFPPSDKIYSWSHLTPLPNVKCLILGQDPYHNYNQAHGLAFSLLEPTRPPPSLVNIYKTLAIDYPQFQIPDYNKLSKEGKPGGGNLTKWAERGVLMLNAVLTVEAHKANSHANQGWELFTEQVIKVAIDYHSKNNKGFVIMAWGSPAQKRVAKYSKQLSDSNHFLVLRTVHPSPLSAHRGFFDLKVFFKCNEWLAKHKKDKIDWGIIDGNIVE